MSVRAWAFAVRGLPRPKQRGRIGAAPGRKPWIYTPAVTREYEQRIAAAASAAGVALGRGPAQVMVQVFPTPATPACDLDNILKCVLDGLVKAGPYVLKDDHFRIVRGKTISIAAFSGDPRIEVTAILEEDAEIPTER